MSVRHALLALLSEGPKYGLRLRQEFESRTGEVWPLNVGQVYLTLQRLERDQLIESDSEESEAYEAHAVLLNLKRKQQDSADALIKIARPALLITLIVVLLIKPAGHQASG